MELKFFKHLVEKLEDWYLTKRTGKNKAERAWEAWYEQMVNYRASDITQMFEKFNYVIEVDPNKFFQFDPFTWVPTEDAKQFFWPARELGTNCVWRFERVVWNEWDQRWHVNELAGGDHVFVACNDEKDAVILSLKYAG